MNKRFNVIVFDWDGTLINSIDWIVHCLQVAATDCCGTEPSARAAKDVIGLSIKRAMQTLFPDAVDATHERLVAAYAKAYAGKAIGPADFFPGAMEMLEELKASGFTLAIATGKTRHGLQEALQGTGTEHLFSVSRCSDETASKPNPKMLLEIMAVTQSQKQHILMVGDSTHDMQMALNADMAAVAIASGTHSQAHLQPFKPLLCLDQAAELLNYLR